MKYKLSIIIPHYNNIELLKKLLSTIPEKPDTQVIVVDDNSPDPVKQEYFHLKNDFDQTRFLFLENPSDSHNAGAARNIGLKYAEGDWLLFADSDDYFIEGFYDAVSEYFDKAYDLVYFKSTSIYLDTGEAGIRHLSYNARIDNYLTKPNRKNEIQLRTRWDVPYSKLIRTEIVRKNNIRFDEISNANDRFFSAQIGFYANKITASNNIIYCITRRRGSLTTSLDLKSFENKADAEVRSNNFLRGNLSSQDFAYIGRFSAYEYLYLILKRRYGIKIFTKYLKIFAQNHMLTVSMKGINRIRSSLFTE